MKLLTPYDVSRLTGLPYSKALMLIKGMPHVQMGNRYYVSEDNFKKFLTQNVAVAISVV